MRERGERRWIGGLGVGFALGLAGVAGGCSGNGEATLLAASPLITDSFASAKISDSCVGGKLDFCTQEHVSAIQSVEIGNAQVLSSVSADAVPHDLVGFAPEEQEAVIHALTPGKSELCVNARFDDKSSRKACTNVEVLSPERIELSFECDAWIDAETALAMVPPGVTLSFSARIFAGARQLSGFIARPLEDSELTNSSYLHYDWPSPAAGGVVELRSRLVGSTKRIGTFSDDQITAISGSAGPLMSKRPTDLGSGHVTDFIGASPVCKSAGPRTRTETPEVCLGPNGESEWEPRSAQALFEYTGVAEGTCRLSFAPAGTQRYLGSLETHIYKLNPDDDAREGTWDAPCPREGLRTCRYGRDSVMVCRSQDAGVSPRWDTAQECDGICDFTASAADCSATMGCAACR